MKTIWTLIKIQFKSRVALKKDKTVKEKIKFGVLITLGLLVFGGFIGLYYMLAGQFVSDDPRHDLGREFLIFTIIIFQVIQTIFLIPSMLKRLDITNERELLLKLPITHKQIFLSKTIVSYVMEVIFASIVLLPILIAYGIATSMHVGFFFLFPIILLFVPSLPFFVASIFIYPAIKLVQFMKSRAIWTSIGYLVGLVGAMALYIFIINTVMGHLTGSGNFQQSLHDNIENIRRWASALFPQGVYANLVNTTFLTALWSFFAILGSSVILLFLAYVIGGFAYKKTYQDERVGFRAYQSKDGFKQRTPMNATIRKEVTNILRSSNYTFQLFLLVIITPMIVFFVDRLSMTTFSESLTDGAQGVGVGIALFVILILLPLSASFAASNITREGHNVYHTKLIPQPFMRQILVKFFVVLIPIAISVILTSFILMIPNRLQFSELNLSIGIVDALYLLFVSLCMAVGYVALGTYLDIRRPLANQVGEGELQRSTPNINFVMILGLVVGVVIGLLAIMGNFTHMLEFAGGFLSFLSQIGRVIRWVFIGLAPAFAVGMCVLLFVKGPKKYAELEQ